ncbi:MAG: glycoside hydrolase family 3 N-terminal domain-containing protein [Cyanobacteriota/Melainabacteria group bacterium]
MSQYSELEKKAGRIIVGRLPADDLPADFARELSRGGMGGITLFRENCTGVDQLSALIADIYKESHFNPVVTVDQEGGAVQRFVRATGSIPSAMAFAACPDRALVRSVMEKACRQMKLLGINLLLAPVLDVLTNPLNPIVSTRSYGSMPRMVERSSREMIDIIEASGLIPVGKHFPGHGATREDSHHTLAVSDVSTDRLLQVDLAPFKALVSKLPAILTGHIWVKCVDDEPLPASLSPRIVNGILKDYLGFSGLVITDDLTMKGLTESSSIEDAAVQAVLAGNHLLLICTGLEPCALARQALVKAVQDGEMEEALLDQAIEKLEAVLPERPRISDLAHGDKKIFALLNTLTKEVGEESHRVGKITASFLKGSASIEEGSSWFVVAPDHSRYGLNLASHLKKYADARYGDTAPVFEEVRYDMSAEFEKNKKLVEGLRGKNCIFLTFRCLINESQMQLGQMLADECAGKIAVCTDTPFDYNGLPDWPCVIATLDPSDRAIEALADALIDGSIDQKASAYYSRLQEGVSSINIDRVMQ